MLQQSQVDLLSRLTRIGRSRSDIEVLGQTVLTQAYAEITATFPFRQFQQVAPNVALSNGQSELPLASIGTDVRYLTGVRINQVPRRLKKWSDTQLDQRQLYTGCPMHYCLYGQTLYFDTITDQAYTLRVRWQRWPLEPYFTPGLTLETPSQWDDVILYSAAAKMLTELLEPDRAVVYQGMADDLIGMLPTEEYVEDADYDQGWEARHALMAQTLSGVQKPKHGITVAERLKIKELRIRPIDGGFSSYDSSWALPPNKSPRQRVEYVQNYLQRPRGGLEVLHVPGDETITYANLFEFNDTTQSVIFLFTKTKAYYAADDNPATPGIYNLHGPIPGTAFTSENYERWSTVQLDYKIYAVSYNNALQYGDGAGYVFVPGAHPARGMFMLNNHMVLVGLHDLGAPDFRPDFQEVMWSQIFTTHPVTFSGAGSGRAALSDTNGIIMNGMPLSPLNAFIYKSDAIIEMRATGDATLPFEFMERTRSMGVMFPYSVVQYKGAQFFVGSDYQVYLYDGSQFKGIGNDIRDELFGITQVLPVGISVDRAIAMYDYTTQEYMLAVATPGTTMLVFAYHVEKKRWRMCEYDNLTYWVTKHLRRPQALGHALYTPYYPVCCTLEGKIYWLVNTSNFSTTQHPIEFLYETPDFVAEKDGEEGTLLQVIVGLSNNDPVHMTMDISHDSGQSFGTAQTLISRVSPPFSAEQALVYDLFETGLKFRVRLRNAVENEVVSVESISLRIASVGDWRREAT